MPPTADPNREPTIAVSRQFVEAVNDFASAWLEDFHDYAEDIAGDDAEQAEREQELERIRLLAETSEALLGPAAPATPYQFRQWVHDLSWFSKRPPVVETDPTEPEGPDSLRLHVNLDTALFSYSVSAVWDTKEAGVGHSYLGATATRHGNGGRDLADGPVTADTWHRILRDIVGMEMTEYLEPPHDPDANLADARANRGFAADIRVDYQPNGGLLVALTGPTARQITQQANATHLTAEEYLHAKLGQPAQTA